MGYGGDELTSGGGELHVINSHWLRGSRLRTCVDKTVCPHLSDQLMSRDTECGHVHYQSSEYC